MEPCQPADRVDRVDDVTLGVDIGQRVKATLGTGPFLQERSVLVELLDAPVARVGDEDPAARIDSHADGLLELSWSAARLAEDVDQVAVR